MMNEHPKKMTVAQAVNPRTDVPSEVLILLRQHSTLEISPFITIITADWLQLGLVTSNRLTRSWSVVELVWTFGNVSFVLRTKKRMTAT